MTCAVTLPPWGICLPDKSGRHTDNDSSWRYVSRDNRPSPHHRLLANRHATHDDRATTNRSAPFHPGGYDLPVGLGLQPAVSASVWILVISEHHAVTDEDFILNGDALAYEGMRRDLAASTDDRVLLNLDEGADLGVVANAAAVQIDQIGLENPRAAAKHNIRSYRRACPP